ncbi:hypothetical protein EMPS_06864 [Entomortierella parvispora]|uniref:FAD-binding domain-containing protein n=1 Tax=Entomortierella parvispora TaxID=205924 RepID=A0A9P3HDB2_9FUNG|nr:hypothetical protein EMPS_06864 [Entomortierella parvispora]
MDADSETTIPKTSPSQPPSPSDGKTPNVLIVGAGIGGLFLAILLDRAGIPYQIFERAATVKPLGSIMSLSPNVMAVIDQLGLLEELKAISFRHSDTQIMYDNMKTIASFPSADIHDEIGYDFLLFSRPMLYQLLLSKVPAERIHFGKKVLTMVQNKDEVMIRCADETTYHGEILVGADGAYSAVRQHMFKIMKDQNELPPSDFKDLSKGFICMVGTTNSLDPEVYPLVKREDCLFSQVIGKGSSFNWSEFNIPEHRVCWVLVSQLATLEESEKVKFRNSEWGPDTSQEFLDQVRDFPVPGCKTLGNLIDATPAENISRVYLEDKLFESWHYGRTVLLGDAAHKLLPSAGQGAVCAMLDSVILANCLYDLESLKPQSIDEAFRDYKEQRYSPVKEQFQNSKTNAIFLYGQTLVERCIRYLALHWVPQSVKHKAFLKGAAYRPQATFLPQVPKRGTGEVLPQKTSKRYEREQKQKPQISSQNQSASQDTVDTTVTAV